MFLNNYTQPAPYSLQNYQSTDLSTEQSATQAELESIQQPLIQPLTLHLLKESNFFNMDQPFLGDERVGNEIHNAIPPLFVDTNTYSVAQPSFQTSNNLPLSHFSEACEAISHTFPNQFTWNPVPISAPNLVPQPISHVNLPAAQPIAPAKTINDTFFSSLRKTHKKRTVQRPSKRISYQPIAPRQPLMQGKGLATPNLVSQRISQVNAPAARPIAPAKTINSAFYGACPPLPKPSLPYKKLMATNPAKQVEEMGQTPPNTPPEKKEKVEEAIQPSLKRKTSPIRAAQHRVSQKTYREKQKEYVENLKEQSKELDQLRNAVEQFSEQIEQFQLPPRLAASKMSGVEILGVLKSELLEMLKQSTKLN